MRNLSHRNVCISMATLRGSFQLLAILTTLTFIQCYETLFESATIPSNWDPATGIQQQGVAVTDTHLAIGMYLVYYYGMGEYLVSTPRNGYHQI